MRTSTFHSQKRLVAALLRRDVDDERNPDAAVAEGRLRRDAAAHRQPRHQRRRLPLRVHALHTCNTGTETHHSEQHLSATIS